MRTLSRHSPTGNPPALARGRARGRGNWQENDAERVVRAALSIPRALADLNRKNEGTAKPALATRIAFISAPAARKNPDPLRATEESGACGVRSALVAE